MCTITDLRIDDVRFPTSAGKHGSDAMNPDPDYSAAYLHLETDGPHTGHGIVFTLGRGTDVCAHAVSAYQEFVVGRSLESITSEPAKFWRELTGDSQLRWLGPEKGVMHMAVAAIVNAVWDLWAKTEDKPLWQLLCDLTPKQLVNCVDFRYLTDALTPDEALHILEAQHAGKAARRKQMFDDGYPAYTTSVGWLGYQDDQLQQLTHQALEQGWSAMKLKVGADVEQDRHRLKLVRKIAGDQVHLMVDANQVWDVPQAIQWMQQLAEFELVWIEEPTSPDDILGHAKIAEAVRPIGVATGEMIQNRVTFKQLMQVGAIDYCQIDSCRLGGVNEVIAVLLLAAKYNIPVCPHGGGVGLCEHIQHLSLFDYIAVSGKLDRRWIEYVDHLHEHFVAPVQVRDGRYRVPTIPGYSIELKPESIERYRHRTTS